jgi:SAM-dependent methyltransferase
MVPLFGVYEPLVDEVTCVDWGNTFHKNEYLDFECDLTQPLPFSAEIFDMIILSDVLEHIFEPKRLWTEMARVLAKAGKLVMNVPFLYCIHEAPYDYYRYTEFALRKFAEDAKLSVMLISPIGGIAEVIADLASKTVAKLPLVGPTFAILIQSIARLFIRTPPCAWLLRATTTRFPNGYFLVVEAEPAR